MTEWQKWEWRKLSVWQKLESLLRGPQYIGEKPTPVWLRVADHVGYSVIFGTVVFLLFSIMIWASGPPCSDKALERAGEEVLSQGLNPSDLDNSERMYDLYVVYMDECVAGRPGS